MSNATRSTVVREKSSWASPSWIGLNSSRHLPSERLPGREEFQAISRHENEPGRRCHSAISPWIEARISQGVERSVGVRGPLAAGDAAMRRVIPT
jgi:hypothetical protein